MLRPKMEAERVNDRCSIDVVGIADNRFISAEYKVLISVNINIDVFENRIVSLKGKIDKLS